MRIPRSHNISNVLSSLFLIVWKQECL